MIIEAMLNIEKIINNEKKTKIVKHMKICRARG